MSREEAIAIIRKEYLCVDRDCDIERSCGKCDLMMPNKEPILQAYKLAIKALEQEPKTDSWSIKDVADTFKKHGLIREYEPCDDAISRDAVNTLVDELARAISDERCFIPQRGRSTATIMQDILDLPPVTQKSEKWISVSERLPEDKTYVLTTIKVPNRIAHARSGWYEGGFFHNDNGDTWKATDMEVKAWMPLPEPYETQESEIKNEKAN